MLEAAAARRTSRTHKNFRRLTGDPRHTHPNKQTKQTKQTNKQTEGRDPVDFD